MNLYVVNSKTSEVTGLWLYPIQRKTLQDSRWRCCSGQRKIKLTRRTKSQNSNYMRFGTLTRFDCFSMDFISYFTLHFYFSLFQTSIFKTLRSFVTVQSVQFPAVQNFELIDLLDQNTFYLNLSQLTSKKVLQSLSDWLCTMQ